MSLLFHRGVQAAIVAATLAAAGCASLPSTSTLLAGSQATLEGTITSIDTQPWAYDGNAVVLLETAAHGTVSVQLPARWNLCKAGQIDVAAMRVGQRVRAVGSVTEDGDVVVCERAEHRLQPLG
ncbi:hypothetical protein [Thermomonas carbonis]|uniref:Uncharacterized protein n=1 Tax=Thermomonas carbonis TaxID=1463158 RepID=A0A7G9SPJ2_9GAMM|nr:hypothetical protein [Thermomonas carbonis]QNN69767.1 hypothetical protein H9L16_14105 [Thermomonas carbonis]